jgi:hypothetical protein
MKPQRSLFTATLICLLPLASAVAQSGLKITYSSKGLQQLSYNGVVLEDLDKFPDDTLRIFHMKMTDKNGVRSSGQYGWGENNNGRVWDPSSHSWTYNFVWGSIRVEFSQHGESLDMRVTEINSPQSGVTLDGAVIYPLVLHFGRIPSGFGDLKLPQLAFNTSQPAVMVADYEVGQVAAVVPDAAKPIYSGFLPAAQSYAYVPLIGSTAPDGLASFQPRYDRAVGPGQTDTFVVSLRFSAAGTPAAIVARDAFKNWANLWPAKLHWADRRIIGTIYLASSPTSGDASQPQGFPNNPRRYFNERDASKFDVRTGVGMISFQRRVLQQAENTVGVLERLKAQGGITWDIEGEQYPQQTSYVCEPDQIAEIAPEMESVVADPNSRYQGMKLDDAYFKVIRDAGFRVGVCVRPQHFIRGKDGTAHQAYLSDREIVRELMRKMRYAHDRWGATLFYIDSTVDQHGAPLDTSLLEKVSEAFPDCLLIPEESTPRYYASTAPFLSFLFHGDTGTAKEIYDFYPHAFSVNLINDVAAAKLAAARSQLKASVARGDILMVHADYWDVNNQTAVDICGSKNESRVASGNRSK